MNHRTALINYLAELATLSKDIAHSNATRESRRFFLWGANEAALLGNHALNNTGWNLLVDMLPAGHLDNRHDYEQRVFRVAMHFVRHTSDQDIPAINATIGAAYELGWEFILRMREHVANPCAAQVDGQENIPRTLLPERIKHQEVAPLLFIGDKHYGYRFEIEVTYDDQIPHESTPARWNLPPTPPTP